jgi:glycosyltransferase involved in cell wall biosynthesis
MPAAVSILLPIRNAAETLPAALDSLLAQTFGDFEIVAVDDGSTDATAAILRQYAARDRRLRPFANAVAAGLVPALRIAHGLAGAPLLARMDADDVAYPERLEKQVALLEADPDLAGCGCRLLVERGWMEGVDFFCVA